MMNNTIQKYSIWLFLGTCFLYAYLFSPVVYSGAERIVNTELTQGDVNTYFNWAQRELINSPFLSWYLKLNFRNLSLVYFAWLNSFFSGIRSFDLFIPVVLYYSSYHFLIQTLKNINSAFTNSVLSFSANLIMICYLQVVTKEIVLIFSISLFIYSLYFQKKIGLVISFLLVAIARPYLAFIFFLSFIFEKIYRDRKKYFLISVLFFYGLILPLSYKFIFKQYLSLPNESMTSGSSFYLQFLQYPVFYIAWLPYRIFLNLVEPLLFLKDFVISNRSLLEMPSFFSLTSAVLIIYLLLKVVSNFKKSQLVDPKIRMFIFFLINYFFILASLPLIHSRYFIPILPLLGFLSDIQLNKSQKVMDNPSEEEL